jgi:uncharacterized protein
MTQPAFFPFHDLARTLLPHAGDANGDGSHDISHLQRVWNNAAAIQAEDGGDAHVLFAATILHDCVPTEKIRRCGRRPRVCPPKRPHAC